MKHYPKAELIALLILSGIIPQAIHAEASKLKADQVTGVIFENVRIFNGTSDQLSESSNVLVVGNAIKAISADPITDPPEMVVTRIQGGGRTLMPGLIDNHVHIFMSANSEKQLIDPKTNPESLQTRAAEEAKDMLLRGFTTVRDLGGPIFDLKRAIDLGKNIGPRIYPSGAMISQTSGHGDFRTPHERSRRFGGKVSLAELLGVSFIADGRDEVLTATRENLRGGASQIKVMAGGGVSSAYDPLDVAQYSLDEMKAAVEATDDWGTYVTVHAYTPKAVRRAIEAGVKCIEHGQLLDEPTFQLLGEKGVWLSLQDLDEAHESRSESVRAKNRVVVQGTDNAFKWAKKYNVKLAWGTDLLLSPELNKNQSSDILKLKKWFKPAEVLKLVTHDNAELLTLSGPRNPYPGKLGIVEPEALADLILVNGDPIANLELVTDPAKNFLVIMKDGKIYKDISATTSHKPVGGDKQTQIPVAPVVESQINQDELLPTIVPLGEVTMTADIVYSTIMGFRPLRLDLYAPAQNSSPKPLVVFVHGGGWTTGHKRTTASYKDFPGVLANLARRGFVVASMEYRLSGEAPYPMAVQDVKTAIRYLRKQNRRYAINPDKVAVWGASAGAHLAAMTAFTCGDKSFEPIIYETRKTSDCVQAFVGWFGPYDIDLMIKQTFGSHQAATSKDPNTEMAGSLAFFHCTEKGCPSEMLVQASPINYVDPKDPPTLLIHGTADKLVASNQTEFLAAKMRKTSTPVEVVMIEGVDHGWRGASLAETQKASQEALEKTFAFLDKRFGTNH